MVLSNKKLKQKLRESHSQEQSCPWSSQQGSRLSKREKRRKISSSQPQPQPQEKIDEREEEEAQKVSESELEEKKKAKKKKTKKKKKRVDEQKEGGAVNVEQPQSQPESEQHNNDTTDMKTKIYVGGIPYYSTQDDIQSFFHNCGTITDVDCMTFPETGNFRGIAIITFKTEAAAKRAVLLDGADMGGLFLKVQPYKTTRAPKMSDFTPDIVHGYNRVYVGNLSWDISEDELRKLFSDCKISNIRFGEDKTTGEFLGYAHVDFSDSLSFTIALKLDQNVVCGRPVRIRCAVPKKSLANSDAGSHSKTNGGGSPISGSGKKRRTCYECGVSGHISSTCPKKQAVDPPSST